MMGRVGRCGDGELGFEDMYVCEPREEFWGFGSWDEFFTRRFREGVRPVAFPDECSDLDLGGGGGGGVEGLDMDLDTTTVIIHACEATPLFRVEGVELHDTFWLKSQPYSLAEMLNGADKALPFVVGQVYQAYLSALSYHRWHAPVSGRVISIENVPGTYYSENYYQGFANVEDGEPRPDPNGPNNSQRYIAEVATRGIMIIDADNPNISLMAAVFIGMCEVSSCEFCVKEGERIKKDQQIGSFHFGGSSLCLVFRPQTNLKFDDPGPYEDREYNKKVNSILAVVIPGQAKL